MILVPTSARREVTVILPVHNGARYLEESIRSVLRQDVDFELHVLDDNSSDASPDIAQSTGDARVRYSRNDGRFGLFKTLNRGFREAGTELVRIWSDDDHMTQGSLRRFVAFGESHPAAGMWFCRFAGMDPQGQLTGDERQFAEQWRRIPECFGGQLAALLFYCFGCMPGNISTVLMRRSIWERLGGFLEGIQQAPDYDMWVRAGEIADVGFIDDALVELRDHPGQLGKQGGKLMTLIEEQQPVIERLEKSLEGVLSAGAFWSAWRNGSGRDHLHLVARALLAGDLRTAWRGTKAIRRYGRPLLPQVATWLLSGNGRLWRLDRPRFFDSIAPRVAPASAQRLRSSEAG